MRLIHRTIKPTAISIIRSTASKHTTQSNISIQSDCDCLSVISALCLEGRLKGALAILHGLDQQNIPVDSDTYGCLLKVCANNQALAEGKCVHAHLLTRGISENVFLGNTLVSMYAECKSIVEARLVFEKISKWNVFSWNAIIRGYVRNEHCEEALTLYYEMRSSRMQPDKFTFPLVLKACAGSAGLQQGKDIHDCIIKSGLESDVFVANALVAMYAKCKTLESARQVFDKMCERDLVSWNAMIAGYAQNGIFDKALELFHQMQLTSIKPDIITWSSVIAGYAQNGHANEALQVFREMQLAGVNMDWVAIVSILPACGNLAAMQKGKEIHDNIIRNGFESYIFVGNALIDMYAKCGCVNIARQVFDKMSVRDVASWSAMIGGYGMHGHGKDALALFYQMQTAGLKPDPITFIGVLSACSHAGLVDEGRQYFDCMYQDYRITPQVEHYACMIDLLGRAGHLNEAYDLVRKMPLEPTASVWGALLGACRIHCNVELGELVSEYLLELQPDHDGNYVLLSNVYAAAGRWDGVTKVRTMMKDRGLKKRPGFSWIEVKNRVHAFLVADRSHPQSEKIYAMLESLAGQMKEAGYMPDTRFVLQDVE
eukprot:Gb_19040 [translate_table: standard]